MRPYAKRKKMNFTMKKIIITFIISAFIATAYTQDVSDCWITIVEDRGITVDSVKNTLQFTRTFEFKNEEIPISIHASFRILEGRFHGRLDSLVFAYNQNTHHIPLENKGIGLLGPLELRHIHIVRLDDFNFDGYLDIGVLNATRSFVYEVFLYNPEKGRFFYYSNLSLFGLVANQETRTIHASVNEGVFNWSNATFKWDNGNLLMIKYESQRLDQEQQLFFRERGRLENGEWIIETDVEKADF